MTEYNYKDTLNLPKTGFPMKANLPNREPNILKHWQQIDLYKQLRQHCQGRPKFMLHDGPPYANGRIHLGTALNKTLKDIILKSKTLSGYDTPYVPGWDCHGLPIELNVEKKVGKAGDKLTVKEFRQACRDYATKQYQIQREDFQRLGVVGQWDKPYLTMNFAYEANTVRALAQIIANGHLHRGQKPVHWCTACASALAEAEVEYRDKQSPAIDVAFTVVDVTTLDRAFSMTPENGVAVIVPIWTTTPWTLPANQAVCVNPEIGYALVACQWQGQAVQFVVAAEMVDAVMQRYEIEDFSIIANANGELLEGIELQHPFLERKVPILLGEHVTTEVGTGCVHTAPAHGVEDYDVSQRYHIEVENPVDGRSCFVEDTPFVAGLHVFKANDIIIETIKQRNGLLHLTTLEHSYPHCWRHKTPLIFRATPQWFISMDQKGLRNLALEAADKVKWIPDWGKTRIENMIESRPDWCISRQRSWGIPIALFVHRQTLEIHPRTPELMDQVAALIEQQGIDAWFELPAESLLGDEADDYDKVTDVLDVWFDSGVTHACVLEQRPELSVPADLYLEGSDQHRGWFQTSLLTALAMRGQAPYHCVLTHGYVVDGKGFKMSKSLGNVIAPSDVVKKLGADVLRLWAAALDHRGDINFSDEIMQRSADAYRRIRNTARFLLSNLNDFDPSKDLVAAEDMLALDRWAVAITQQLQQDIVAAYEQYQFPAIFQKIHNFCTVQMGSFYLDVIKDRQYTSQQNGLPRRSAQTAMYHIIEALVRWLAPILTFTAEEIWQHMPGERADSVYLSTWYDQFPRLFETTAQAEQELKYWQSMMSVRNEVNKILEQHRQSGTIGSALETEVTLYAENNLLEELLKLGDELRFVLITSGANACTEQQRNGDAEETDIPGLFVNVNVSSQQKCIRCWQRRDDVGNHAKHPELCGRCIANIGEQGEQRQFA